MTNEDFLTEMQDVLQTEEELSMDTVLEDLDEWDSLSVMATMAFLEKSFGVTSRNIAKDTVFFETFGYHPQSAEREDAQADIRVQFLSADNQPDLELVANLNKEGPVTPHLQVRRKIFHFAYETDDIETDARKMIDEQNASFLVPITQVEDGSSSIKAWCYLMFRNMMIVELVELKG